MYGGVNVTEQCVFFLLILSSMLKGIAPQLKAMSIYLQGQAVSEPSCWQSYLLTVQNNTLQLLKLTTMVFTQLQAHLPRQIPATFDRAVSALKVYLSNRPNGQPEEQHGSAGVWQQDEVTRFLENKPQIDTKDEQRGELLKFLTMNEQKERNTQMMLEFVPRYSANHGLSHLPSLQRSSLFRNERVQRPSDGQGGQGRESVFGRAITQLSSSSREAGREKERAMEAQVQTELTLLKSPQMITFQGDSAICKESHDTGTGMSGFTYRMIAGLQEESKEQGLQKLQKEEQAVLSNQGNRKDETGQKQKNPQGANIQSEQRGKNSEGKGERNSLASSNKLITRQEEKSKPKNKKNEEKRDSNLLAPSKKDVLKAVGKKQARKSKEVKENKEVKETKEVKEDKDSYGRMASSSIFGKESKGFTSFNPFQAIRETPQDLVASAEYCPTPQNGQSHVIRNDKQEKTEQSEGPIDSGQKAPFDSLQKGDNLQQKTLQRDKSSSDQHHLTHFPAVAGQTSFSSTAAMPFYRKQSKTHQNNSSLPKIQERSRPINDRTQSLKRRIYDSSPYLTTSLHYGAKQQNIISSKGVTASSITCNQHAHHSLHINPADQSEREGLLREEEAKMVREIQALGTHPAQKQWSRILRGIRHYQRMHATLCGQNCVHLNKFYQFLRRRNLGNCLNRRLLLPHKKNIEITATL